jgi:hypothetical protein
MTASVPLRAKIESLSHGFIGSLPAEEGTCAESLPEPRRSLHSMNQWPNDSMDQFLPFPPEELTQQARAVSREQPS